ncbi:MAG: trehalose-phosphatase [Betaproteobacteria bacterium]
MDARPAEPLPDASSDWAYFVDIDGTLIDIAETPDAIRVDHALLGLIARLHRACGGAVALVSGRSLTDVEHRLGGVRIPVAGQHGLERRDAHGRLRRHVAAAKARRHIQHELQAVLDAHPALLLEDKGLSLALHYRRAPELAAFIHRTMERLVGEVDSGLGLQQGKCVLEVKSMGFDKGTAVEEFMAESPFLGRRPVFVGDDVTDEYGFAAVNRLGGISIKVGAGRTEAHWRLRNVAAVRAWLGSALTRKEEMHEKQS